MPALLLKNCIFGLIVTTCYGVDLDYINAEYMKDGESNENKLEGTMQRTEQAAETSKVSTDHILYNFDYDERKVYWFRRKINKIKKSMNKLSPAQNTASSHFTRTTAPPKTTINMANIFKYNDYSYDEVPSENFTLKSGILRTNSKSLQAESTVADDDSKNLSHNFTDNSTDNLVLAEMFNMEPAIEKFDPSSYDIPIPKDTWYVPESYPCWDLPILYGKRKKRNANDGKVFLMYAPSLIDVVDKDESEPVFIRDSNREPIDNKWCSMPPCYGDHILCLFPHQVFSPFCGAGYKAKRPTMMQRVAIVNTVNSIRNHIATGSKAQNEYPYLPPAANMRQILYDYDLESMARRWLRQCLPGPSPCVALDSNYVSQLECTKYAENCCYNLDSTKCTPEIECSANPVIGCLHAWFWSAGAELDDKDLRCGHIESNSFALAQLLWAQTYKMGCAYGEHDNGDVRVVCNFAPGAPFVLETKYYCGFIYHKDVTNSFEKEKNDSVTGLKFLDPLGIALQETKVVPRKKPTGLKRLNHRMVLTNKKNWGIVSLRRIYTDGWVRKMMNEEINGTVGAVARLVTKYKFKEDTLAKCDTEEPMFIVGPPGSLCLETGRKFHALCYEFRDPTPGFRLVAVIAPVALFSLILYDLFSGVIRQTNN